MSAHAYIHWADVPQELIDSSKQHIDPDTREQIIAFKGCPLSGVIEQTQKGLQVEFPMPRLAELRHGLADWFLHWGINYYVVA